MTKLELEDDNGVKIMEEILTKVVETAEKALDMEMDTSLSLGVGMENNSEVRTWADVDIEMETAVAEELVEMEVDDRLGEMVVEVVHNITQDGQAEVVVDLEDMETGNGLRVVNDNDPEECIISVHCAGNCVYNIYNTGKKTR